MKAGVLVFVVVLIAITGDSSAQDNKDLKFKEQKVELSVDQFQVSGSLLLPDGGGRRPVIVVVWGSGPTDRRRYIERSKTFALFIKQGYAVFVDDKPGSGASTGEFTPGQLLEERARILAREIELLREHPAVEPKRVGLFGSSQAGYVMPVAISTNPGVSFVIACSIPAQSSLDQSAYLVRNYLLCEGAAPEEAAAAERYYIQRGEALSYADYLEAASYLDGIPAVKDGLEWGGIVSQDEFVPPNADSEDFLDPADLIKQFGNPVLVILAENDKQVDPRQAADVFGRLLQEAGNDLSRIHVIEGVDHNMVISETGCIQDQRDGYASIGGATVSPEFYEVIKKWLNDIRIRPRRNQ